ncbi:Mitochondrial ribosome-associated GTPase 1 [Trichinella britovi]|uniref:Mitochondrial GTPase 1 n=2 Tax=Trichinella TaxID=6333 RepID=A0A0V1DGM9_TRIBR|nr:Mitochondrial ribosome-associated GTPase 1 [Trichinella murrelli]KRX66414.1 Mitochondrial ribosome-associated GTPase 1 [Trichinella sp. T9]KRY60768.1 Mitochondrial ribosome-associated GTPase 1 [Trichinella britovi]
MVTFNKRGFCEAKHLAVRNRFALPDAARLSKWFPAHMFTGMKQMQAKVRLVDYVVEVHDARIPFTGRNQQFYRLLYKGKPHLLLLNKADLISKSRVRDVERMLMCKEDTVLFGSFNGRQKDASAMSLMNLVRHCLNTNEQRFHRQYETDYNVMIVGIPNVGKSTIINSLRARFTALNSKACAVGQKPGVTRSVMNRVRICDQPKIYVFDTPGVLAPQLQSDDNKSCVESILKLALCQCLPNRHVGLETLCDFLLYMLNRQNNFQYVDHLGLSDVSDSIHDVLQQVAEQFHFKRTMSLYGVLQDVQDFERAAEKFLTLFRLGILGDQFLDFEFLNQ